MAPNCVAIIPARGGSKRIPRKNIKPFHGKPLISYSITAALDSHIFDRVVVSTDDLEIKEVAEFFGAEVPYLRSPELSTDTVMTVPVISDAISRLKLHDNTVVCCIYPTAPLLEIDKLIQGFEIFAKTLNASYVCAVTDFPYPIQRALFRDAAGMLNMGSPEFLNTRSQDLPEAFHDAGQFYFAYAKTWASGVPMLMNTVGIFLERWKVQDLDTPEDWKRLTALYEILYR